MDSKIACLPELLLSHEHLLSSSKRMELLQRVTRKGELGEGKENQYRTMSGKCCF